MQTLNGYLLDHLLTDEFIKKCFYPEDSNQKSKVAEFASEFFMFYRSLVNELRVDISEKLRKMDMGILALQEIKELLFEEKASTFGPVPERVVIEIELCDSRNLKKEWERQRRNLLLSHIEILHLTAKKDAKYLYELFSEFEQTEDLIESILSYPDDSKHSPYDLLSFRCIGFIL